MLSKSPVKFNPITQNLHKTVFLMDRIADHCLREKMHLTFSQFRILVVAYKHKGITQAKIAKFHDLTRAAVKRQVEILKKTRLLEIKKEPGHKEQILILTTLGQNKIQKALQEFNKIFTPIYKTLNTKEQKTIETSLKKLIDVLHGKMLTANH
jgi:DNA-binding MarR family transcriptional regulator